MGIPLIEELLRTYLIEQGFSNVYCNEFPNDVRQGILIKRDGSGVIDDYLPIDEARVLILCRDSHPQDSMKMALKIQKLLHRQERLQIKGNIILSILQNTGISYFYDNDTGLDQHLSYYFVKYFEEV